MIKPYKKQIHDPILNPFNTRLSSLPLNLLICQACCSPRLRHRHSGGEYKMTDCTARKEHCQPIESQANPLNNHPKRTEMTLTLCLPSASTVDSPNAGIVLGPSPFSAASSSNHSFLNRSNSFSRSSTTVGGCDIVSSIDEVAGGVAIVDIDHA